MSYNSYKICEVCGYEEEHFYNFGKGGSDHSRGGLKGNFKELENGLKACPNCSNVTYEGEDESEK